MSSKEREIVFTVEKIVRTKKTTEGQRYLVKWEGYTKRHNSWEPARSFSNFDMLENFW